ncbi:MAG: PepSY-like domain-containing protein [Bacteroidales bacterium]|nr:PepSY-like domain-containing protein [Bacteroidales bacterium]
MKIFRFLFIAAALQLSLGLFTSLNAQKLKTDDVPGDVTQSFTSEYPSAKLSSWALEGDQYVAIFKDDGSNGKAYFTNDGTWVKTTYDIPTSEIPLSISKYVTENYPNYEISVCNLREMPKVNTHYYLEVRFPEVGGKEEPSVLTFDYVGNLLNREDPVGFVLRTEEPAHAAANQKPAKTPAKADREEVSRNNKEKDDDYEKPEKIEKAKAEPAKKGKKGKKEAAEPFDPWAKYAIAESQVPTVVQKMFKKKATKPENTKWFLVGETYIGKCVVRELPVEVYISKKGAWKKTYSYMLQERITSAMVKHIETYYKGYKFIKAFKELRADKKNKVYIEFYEKKNYKKKLPTGIWFDEKTRKMIRTVDPNFEDPFNDPDLFTNTAPSQEDIQAAIDELPAAVKSYISTNYPPYKIREADTENDPDLGDIYRVEITSGGSSYITLFFDKSGKFLKKEMSDGMKTVKSYGDYDEIEVPEVVINAFKAKFPRIDNPVWDEDENENFDVQFTGTKGKEMCIFSPDGQLLEDLFFLDETKVIPEIENYLKSNYGKYEILNYFSVKKDNTNHYKLIIMPHKAKYSKYLWFSAKGEFEREE